MRNVISLLVVGLALVGCSKDAIEETFVPTAIEKEIVDTTPVETTTPTTPTSTIMPEFTARSVDYSKGSYFTRTAFPEVDWDVYGVQQGHMNHGTVILDYDNDGILDLIIPNSSRTPRQFNKMIIMKGDGKGFVADNLNSNIDGPTHNRKTVLGDFDSNGYVDVMMFNHGYDFEEGWTEADLFENNILLMNYDGVFERVDLASMGEGIGFYHTGATGDIDNDGDLDIITIDGENGAGNSLVYVNDGSGNFTITPMTQHNLFSGANNYFLNNWNHEVNVMKKTYTVELYDVNEDGFVDMVTTGHDDLNPSKIFFGSSNGFDEYVTLPSMTDYSVAVDLDFLDVDNDGSVEIIFTRTGDEQSGKFYRNAAIQIVTQDGEDVTDMFVDKDSQKITTQWNAWVQWLEVSNDMLKDDSPLNWNRPTWHKEGGKFIKY